MDRNVKFLSFTALAIVVLGIWILYLDATDPSYIPPAQNSPIPSTSTQPIATQSSTLGLEGEKVLVTQVVDGDTLKIESGQTVRLIGIDTPETKDPRRPVGCFGKQASNETKSLLLNKVVILQKDVSETDKYQRLLRYVYLPLEDGSTLFVQDYLVREGFAKVLTYPPDVKYNEQLREAEKFAREENIGLWGRCK